MIYLDTAATSFPKPPAVAEEVSRYLKEYAVSTGRSSYGASVKVTKKVFNCREKLSRLLNIQCSERIIFTLNATYAINFVLKGFLKESDTVIISSMEHNAVMRPLNYLKENRNINIIKVPASPEGRVDLNILEKKLSVSPKLCIINHASNVNGIIQDIDKISKLCGENKVPLLVDAAQSVLSTEVNISKTGIDMLAFSGHKGLMGPTGVGCLYIDKNMEITPLIQGGTGSSSEDEIQPEFYPDRFESGTLNTASIIGLNAALDFIFSTGPQEIIEKKKEITEYLVNELKGISGIKIYGPEKKNNRVSVVSINIAGKMPSEVASLLNSRDICIRSGLHCCPAAHKTLGTKPSGTIRISPGYFTLKKDIDRLIDALNDL